MGGDLCGKGLAPVVRYNGGWKMPLAGEERYASSEEELDELEKLVRQSGLYPRRMSQEEFERISADSRALDEVFEAALVDGVRRWMELADERLAKSEAMAYVMPGNDDPWAIDAALADRDQGRRLRRQGRAARGARDALARLVERNPLAHRPRARRAGAV